jgi:nickel-dependent lactate racemase
MNITLKYGHGEHSFGIPDKGDVSIFRPEPTAVIDSLGDATERALYYPVGCDPFADLLQQKTPKTIAIAVPDETRMAPLEGILPVILQQLHSALPELDPSNISIVVGGGLHVPMDADRMQKIVPPESAPGCRVIAHDLSSARFVAFGTTRRGTPVRINAEVAEADFKIVIGQIDPHQFVGFTGGSKGIVVGCAARETIETNHSMMFDDGVDLGVIDGNPIREDLNEAGDMVGIDFAVNVIFEGDKNVISLLAGKPISVLREGAKECAKLYGTAIEKGFDIVVASCGGHPKDICLYQAQKGLNMASHAARPGGKILLLAASPQGAGDAGYLEYVSRFSTPEEIMEAFPKREFKMGPHKAFQFARTLTKYDVAVFSDMDEEALKRCQLRPADPESTIEKWVEEFDGMPRVAVVTNANVTYFYRA